jgi:tRNA(Arg) A34 adenosine deaminase TadA
VQAGDQPYGAVVLHGGRIVGEAPSRVVSTRNHDAHAEREAIADARKRLGVQSLKGYELVSTSHPCSACERAARDAGISSMIHGESLSMVKH